MTLTLAALRASDAVAITNHLLRLAPNDRSLRFPAGLVADESIRRYVAIIRFGNDVVLGLRDEDDLLVGLAHGCVYRVAGERRIECAFSIDAAWRGRRYGVCLMDAIEAFAGTCGATQLVGSCLCRNAAMRRLFERAGMALTREGDEMHAARALTPTEDWSLAA
jgi:RimJ/RimL family protein N-acetyltransferase